MIKGLEALKELRENGAVSFSRATISFTYLAFTKRADIIEKELKTLAIISRYFYSEHIIHDLYCLGATDEEIALAREVLKE